jgi:alpha-galactosidase
MEQHTVPQPKIVFLGAGSTVFARNLLQDLFTFPELSESTISLMDIDPQRLSDTEAMAHRLANQVGAKPAIEATTDLRKALDGADYAINMIQVGGYRPSTVIDFEIPKKYGLRQTIGDTLGIGGIMRALRTIPPMLEMGRTMEELCPDALFLNYSNPMAMLCMAMNRATSISTVGLCHSVQGTSQDMAHWIGVPYEEVEYLCAGINHVAFFLKFQRRDGEDLYPLLREVAVARKEPAWERTRFELFRTFGYFVTESSEHFSEYVPWFIKPGREDLIQKYNIPLDEYPARCENQIAEWGEFRSALLSSEPDALTNYHEAQRGVLHGMTERRIAMVDKEDPALGAQLRAEALSEQGEDEDGHSGEYGTLIIHSMETNQPRVINGNVNNSGAISNLPLGCAVEVPCLIDANGVQPTVVGALPPQLAALMRTNIGVQELTVEAALTGRRDHVYQAAMLDPHTAAELDPQQIVSLVDELIAAHGEMMPEFR